MAGFFKSLFNKITNRAEIDWDDLEADLISSDLGVRMSTSIIDELRDLGREVSAEDVVETTRRQIAKRLPENLPPPAPRAGVWVEGAGTAAGSSPPRVVLNQKGYQFAQSLLVVPLHTTVEFPNDDPDFHNVFSLSRTKRFDAGRYKKSERPAPTATFDKAGLVRLQCEIHDHMKAVILVVDSRHFTTTDAAGKFTLSGLPPGTYTLHAQFDEKAKWSTSVTISAGKTTAADFASNPSVP